MRSKKSMSFLYYQNNSREFNKSGWENIKRMVTNQSLKKLPAVLKQIQKLKLGEWCNAGDLVIIRTAY